jgi:hypothetical protein
MNLRTEVGRARLATWYDVIMPPVQDSGLHQVSCRAPRQATRSDLSVAVLERATPLTVTVSWSDSLVCRYGEQVWIRTHAAVAGNCVLSGRAIRAGDEIYQPRETRPPPLNRGAMMLAECADSALQTFSGQRSPVARRHRKCRRWDGPDRLRIAFENQRMRRQGANPEGASGGSGNSGSTGADDGFPHTS